MREKLPTGLVGKVIPEPRAKKVDTFPKPKTENKPAKMPLAEKSHIKKIKQAPMLGVYKKKM